MSSRVHAPLASPRAPALVCKHADELGLSSGAHNKTHNELKIPGAMRVERRSCQRRPCNSG